MVRKAIWPLLGLILMLYGIPGMIDDWAIWQQWFSDWRLHNFIFVSLGFVAILYGSWPLLAKLSVGRKITAESLPSFLDYKIGEDYNSQRSTNSRSSRPAGYRCINRSVWFGGFGAYWNSEIGMDHPQLDIGSHRVWRIFFPMTNSCDQFLVGQVVGIDDPAKRVTEDVGVIAVVESPLQFFEVAI